ncbi:MAG TPA: hypothetical protein VFB14_22300 [Bryobacteraceae bacterium]|nr:hypothetical protein [Bryobacteraceae bacterium]
MPLARATAWQQRHNIVAKEGNIIAIIITIHMPMNEAVVSSHVRPGIRIHIIDIVQPPGMGMPCIVDIDMDQKIVSAALVAKSNAQTATKTRAEFRSRAKPRAPL